MSRWTVYLETDFGPATDPECNAVQDHLHEALKPVVGNPYGSLAVTLENVEEPYPSSAVKNCTALFSHALMKAGVALDSQIVRASAWEWSVGGARMVPAFITNRGLAERFGVSRQYIDQLMKRKRAPEPVEIEGADRAVIFRTDEAAPYVAEQLGRN